MLFDVFPHFHGFYGTAVILKKFKQASALTLDTAQVHILRIKVQYAIQAAEPHRHYLTGIRKTYYGCTDTWIYLEPRVKS